MTSGDGRSLLIVCYFRVTVRASRFSCQQINPGKPGMLNTQGCLVKGRDVEAVFHLAGWGRTQCRRPGALCHLYAQDTLPNAQPLHLSKLVRYPHPGCDHALAHLEPASLVNLYLIYIT